MFLVLPIGYWIHIRKKQLTIGISHSIPNNAPRDKCEMASLDSFYCVLSSKQDFLVVNLKIVFESLSFVLLSVLYWCDGSFFDLQCIHIGSLGNQDPKKDPYKASR